MYLNNYSIERYSILKSIKATYYKILVAYFIVVESILY